MRQVIIIDNNIEVCRYISGFLSSEKLHAYYTITIEEGLELINIKRPEIIIGDKSMSNLETLLHQLIDAIENYDPDVFLMDTKDALIGRNPYVII